MTKAQRELFRQTLADLAGADVVYSNEPQPIISTETGTLITVSRVSNVSNCIDTQFQVTGVGGQVATTRDFRYAVYSIRLDALAFASEPADEQTEKLALKLWRRAAIDGLTDGGIALVDVLGITDLPINIDSHADTSSAFQVKLGYQIQDTDLDFDYGVIQSVSPLTYAGAPT